MRQYKFDKPLVESATPPRSTDVYWIDVDETTRDLLTIKKYESSTNKWENALAKPGYFSVTTSVAGEGMTLAADKSFCKAGDTVVLTVSLEEGYHVDDIEITYSEGTIFASEIDETHWSFVMPSGDAEVIGSAEEGELVGKIRLFTQFADPTIEKISCTGDIKVTTIKNGAPLVEIYTDLNENELSIQADENTQIVISGADITHCTVGENSYYTKISVTNTAITSLICRDCYVLSTLNLSENKKLINLECDDDYSLTSLDVSKNTMLEVLTCPSCFSLTSVDASENVALTSITCNDCWALSSLNLSKCTMLTQLYCDDNPIYNITSIYYPATNSDVATAVAGALTNANSTTGTVYTDSTAAYYSTIANTATAKGWTILPIPE